MDKISNSPTQINLTKGNFSTKYTIKREEITTARRTIGVCINPTGNYQEEYNFCMIYTRKWQKMIGTTRLTRQESFNAYRTVFIPSISCPLGAIYLSPEQCHSLQSQALKTYLPKIGFNHKFPQKVIYGPPHFGGWGEKKLYNIMAINQIKLFIGHVRNNDDTRKLLISELEYVQLISGIQYPVLNKGTPTHFLKWTPPCWITNFKLILTHNEGETKIANQWTPSLQRKNNIILMEAFYKFT